MRAANQLVLLQKKATELYNAEKELSCIFDVLQANTTEVSLKEGISREAEENKRHCARLEGLLVVMNRNPFTNAGDEISKEQFTRQFVTILRRIGFQHVDFGYRTAIYVASQLGQNEIADHLHSVNQNQ